MTKRCTDLFILTGLLAATPAFAGADVVPTLTAPSGTYVYDVGTYTVTVDNVGNRTAKDSVVVIDLPVTQTSPQVYVMGEVSGLPANCSLSGTEITCAFGSIRKNRSASASFDLMLPENTYALDLVAIADASNEPNNASGNNLDTLTTSLLNDSVSVITPANITIEHCTGQNLSSFYECTISPGSVSSHEAVYHGNGTLSFPMLPANFGGTWTQPSPTELAFTYTDNGVPFAGFTGRGVGQDCWEGQTIFSGSTYLSMYRVCID